LEASYFSDFGDGQYLGHQFRNFSKGILVPLSLGATARLHNRFSIKSGLDTQDIGTAAHGIHNILGPPAFINISRRVSSWIGLAVWLALTLAASCWDWKQVFVRGEVYFVDPDCYSRMTRVQRVIAAPWKAVTFHDFENAPQGITPHTTAPTDLLLAALEGTIRLALGITGIQPVVGSIDLAGVFLSPLLGLALVAFLWWWGRKLNFHIASGRGRGGDSHLGARGSSSDVDHRSVLISAGSSSCCRHRDLEADAIRMESSGRSAVGACSLDLAL
jgi:hypothetical protein